MHQCRIVFYNGAGLVVVISLALEQCAQAAYIEL